MSKILMGQEGEHPNSYNRLYYRIGEVSRLTGLKPHVLRYWESEFKVIKPHKAGSFQRLYRKKDVETILKIKKLLYEDGYTIAGAKKKIRDLEKIDTQQIKSQPIENRQESKERELLIEIREELKDIRKLLE